MKYFLDTEFLEGTQKGWFGRNTKPTIDLISIGIICEDGREYYAISKDFNLKEAWNRYDEVINKHYPLGPEYNKVYWIRENVIKPIFKELVNKFAGEEYKANNFNCTVGYNPPMRFTYKNFKKLINKYGKTNKQIAEEVYEFCSNNYHKGNGLTFNQRKEYPLYDKFKPEFYGYYSDYDWVVFCWLFGKMIDLPKGFPMYCIDLKQSLNEKVVLWADKIKGIKLMDFESQLDYFKKQKSYPKQINEHNALADAIFCRDLHKFLNNLI